MQSSGIGQARIGQGKARVKIYGLLEICNGIVQALAGTRCHLLPAAKVGLQRRHVLGRDLPKPFLLPRTQGRLQGICDRCRNLGLNGKDILCCQFRIIRLRPQVFIGFGIDQLHIDTHLVPRSLYTPFQESRHTQLFSDGPHVLGGIPVTHD